MAFYCLVCALPLTSSFFALQDRNFAKGSEARAVGDVKNLIGMTANKKSVGKKRDEFGEIIKKGGTKKKGNEAELPRDNGYADTFVAKHDRWNGYDPDRYKEVIDRYEKVEDERRKKKAVEVDEDFKRKAQRKEEKRKDKERKRKLKEKKLEEKLAKAGSDNDGSDSDGSDSDSDSDDSDSDNDDMKMVEDAALGAGFDNHEGGSKGIRTTVRNLRIREDTAKYLYNLDPSSAYYDPKTRSMRADPRPHLPAEDKLFAGDLMVKASGETSQFTNEQLYAWEASQRGQNLTIEAAPSAAHFMHKQFEGKKESLADKQKRILAEKYGNAAKEAPDQALLLGQSEQYMQYGRDGRVVKGEDKVIPKTKYAEDILIGNHTQPWGSYYDSRQHKWGFACCHQMQRAAYCVKVVTQEALPDAEAMPPPPAPVLVEREMLEEAPKLSKKELRAKEKQEEKESAERLKKALEKEKKKLKQNKDEDEDDRKRKYNSMMSTDVTEEEMEAYKMAKLRDDDPMAKFV